MGVHRAARGLLALLLASFGPAEVAAAESAPALDLSRVVSLHDVTLEAGDLVLEIADGTLLPVTGSEAPAEALFLGSARVRVTAPDEIEAGQLELFTGSRYLDRPVRSAVLVAPGSRLPAGGRAPTLSDDELQAARGLLRTWLDSTERRALGLDGVRFLAARGEPDSAAYFAAWFPDPELGAFLYRLRPDDAEPQSISQFLPTPASDAARREVEEMLLDAQRDGRKQGIRVDDVGRWDTWFSAPLDVRGPEGREDPTRFDPSHYAIDMSIAEDLRVSGRCRLDLEAPGGSRVVSLQLHPDLRVEAAHDGAGSALELLQVGDEILVALREVPAAGERLVLEVEWSGPLFHDPELGNPVLREPTDWYPNAGATDLATYEATFRWPRGLGLLAGGAIVAEGEEAGRRWQHRRLAVPASTFSFEIGQFELLRSEAGHVQVELAFGPSAFWRIRQRQELLETIADALGFFEDLWGPYPLDSLTVVTTPRPYSQAMLGFITLSSAMMADHGGEASLGYRRGVVAHELAHQWWGHLVGWRSYRDRWITEAMANYSAQLYTRARDPGAAAVRHPGADWSEVVTRASAAERPLEALGPLVLGQRLASSLSADAFRNVVYGKGARVLSTLAERVGEETFLAALRSLAATSAHRSLSTEEWMLAVSRLAGVDLGSFLDQFVYGTGLPEVLYDYETLRDGDGWLIRGEVRQTAPYYYRWRVAPTADGRLDARRQSVELMDVGSSVLVVPLVLALRHRTPRGTPGEIELVSDRLRVEGAVTSFELHTALPPRELWLDPDGEIYARFFNARRAPKASLLREGERLAALGRPDDAEAVLALALETRVFPTGDPGRVDRRALRYEEAALDAAILAELVRLRLDGGRLDEARLAFAGLERAERRAGRPAFEPTSRILEARLELAAGNPERAFRLLHRPVLVTGEVGGSEALLLLAIAAQETGHTETLALAAETARQRGADVSALSVTPSTAASELTAGEPAS